MYLTNPRSGDAVDVMRLPVKLEADVAVEDLLLAAVEVAVQGLAGEVFDALVDLGRVGRQLDEDVSEQLDQLLVLELAGGQRRREEEPQVDPGSAGQPHRRPVVATLCDLQKHKINFSVGLK